MAKDAQDTWHMKYHKIDRVKQKGHINTFSQQ